MLIFVLALYTVTGNYFKYHLININRHLLLKNNWNTAQAMKKTLIKNCCMGENSERYSWAYINDQNYHMHQALDFYEYWGKVSNFVFDLIRRNTSLIKIINL